MKLAELTAAVGLRNYAVVATSSRRYEERLKGDGTEQALVKNALNLLNCKI